MSKSEWQSTFTVENRGKTIQDDDFSRDVVLRVDGDFEDDGQRVTYAQSVVDRLNGPNTLQLIEREHIALLYVPARSGWEPFWAATIVDPARTHSDPEGGEMSVQYTCYGTSLSEAVHNVYSAYRSGEHL